MRETGVSRRHPWRQRGSPSDILSVGPAYRIELRNHNTDTVSQGRTHAEDPTRVGFIFSSTTPHDIMREGDLLHLRVLDRNAAEVLSMDFPVLKEDIDEFSKSIMLESLGYSFSSAEPATGKTREAGA